MIVFEDIFSGSEVCSDAFPFRSIFEDTILEVDAQFITVKDDFAPEDEEPTSERVINVVSKFNLQPGPELKNSKALVEAIGPVIARLRKHIKATNPDRLDAFKAQGARFVKEFLVPNAKELEVYRPDGAFEPEDMLVFCKWGDDGESLKFYYFKDSLKSIRC